MKLPGSAQQRIRHPLWRADGTVASGGTAQLILGQSLARSLLVLQNISTGPLWFEHGCGSATAALSGSPGANTNNSIASITVTNAGFNFTKPPLVRILGGGSLGNTSFIGAGQPNYDAPQRQAKAIANISGGAISSITVTDPGSGYIIAPYVHIEASDLDPNGCALPAVNVGLLLPAGAAPLVLNGTCCWTDAIAVFGETTGQQFLCRWMD